MHCNEEGRYVLFESDENGFNNPRGLWGAGPLQAAVVGDSLARGYCVEPGREAAAVLRERLPRTLNLGRREPCRAGCAPTRSAASWPWSGFAAGWPP